MKRQKPGPLAACERNNGSIIPYLSCDFKKKHENSAYPENTPTPRPPFGDKKGGEPGSPPA
jgi:hypothetical protein